MPHQQTIVDTLVDGCFVRKTQTSENGNPYRITWNGLVLKFILDKAFSDVNPAINAKEQIDILLSFLRR